MSSYNDNILHTILLLYYCYPKNVHFLHIFHTFRFVPFVLYSEILWNYFYSAFQECHSLLLLNSFHIYYWFNNNLNTDMFFFLNKYYGIV